MSLVDATYPVRLGFAPESVAIPDPDHPGLLRAGPRASAPYGNSNIEVHVCEATDCGDGRVQPDLKTFGFDTVDLSPLEALQEACAGVRAAGAIASDQAGEIRAALDGSVLRTSDGGSLRVMHIADEGFIMRTDGTQRSVDGRPPVVGYERSRSGDVGPRRPGRVRDAGGPVDGRSGTRAVLPRLARRPQPRRLAPARELLDSSPADHPATGTRRRAQHRPSPAPAPVRTRHRLVPRARR